MSNPQPQRIDAAQHALASGYWTFTPTPQGWQVQTPVGVFQLTPAEHGWACTCPVYGLEHLEGGSSLDCKHVEGLRLYLAGLPTEQQLNQPASSGLERKDNLDNQNNSPITGWTKLFHPKGIQVTLPIPFDQPITPEMAAMLLYSTSVLLDAGWMVNAPGLEDGERLDELGAVARRTQVNDDGSETPIVDLYPANDRLQFKLLHIYLNKPEEVQGFEAATGLRLADIPAYDGAQAIQRGSSPKLDKYIVAFPRPVKVVWQNNPRYEGDEDKKHPKRLFVRWGDIPAARPAAASAPASQPASAPATTSAPAAPAQPDPAPALPDPTRCAVCGQPRPYHAPGCSEFKRLTFARQYIDGEQVNGNASEQAAYDRYVKAESQLPASRQALSEWAQKAKKEAAAGK